MRDSIAIRAPTAGKPLSRSVRDARTSIRRAHRRLEAAWAWVSLLGLLVAWDAALRLDEHVSLPRIRIAHAAEDERIAKRVEPADL